MIKTASTGSVGSFRKYYIFIWSITASQGNIGGKTISSSSAITATGSITGGSISTSGTVSAASVAAIGEILSNTITTNTLTTAGALINIKSDLVLFKGNEHTIYLEAQPNGVLCSKGFLY